MTTSHLSGPLVCPGGFVGNITGNVNGFAATAVDTLTGAGAISTTVGTTQLVTTGANALTLAVPTIAGVTKTVILKTDGGDGTLALTNVTSTGGSTTCTFNDANDAIVLRAGIVGGKWYLIANYGCTLA